MTEFNSRVAFYRKSRRGQILRLVRDKYLHDEQDIGAGTLHGHTIPIGKLKNIVREAPHQQILIIDTNVALHQIDVLEYKCPATSLVVVLQTVLQELRHLNLAAYKRITELIKDESKSFIFYPNEFSSNTNSYRLPEVTINDANDRAIREASQYFADILESDGKVVFISNDKENARRAKATNLITFSMRQYVQLYLQEYPELMDLVANELTGDANQSPLIFSAHLATSEISTGLKSKKLLRGTIRCKRDDWTECYVIVHGDDKGTRRAVTISGRLRVNRALDGDVVAVELVDCPRDATDDTDIETQLGGQSAPPSTGAAMDTAEPTIEAIEGINVEKSTITTFSVEQPLYGRVAGIIRRNWRQYAGVLHDFVGDEAEDESGKRQAYFLPMDKKIPNISISSRRLEDFAQKKILVAIDSWPANSAHPLGHFVRMLGAVDEKSVETQALLHEFNVTTESFSTEVMACLPPATWQITTDVITQRTDLRHLPICSIDPPGCKDIDDALHCITLSNGNYQVGVHIADVTHFVHPDSAIDKEAAHRSTSTYLVERRLDMLPGLLTTDLCSLRSSEDHLAFSVVWEMDPAGNILAVEFFKSVIRSKASLTYEEAQTMLDSPMPSDPINSSVNELNKLAKIFRQRRIDTGALTLASPEVKFKLDQETSNPTDVGMYVLRESNALVEEFMLLANITVAKKILRHYPTLGVLRRHQPPSKQQFTSLLSAAQAVGVEIDITSSKTLADSLDLATRPEDPYFNKLLRILSTRCMMPAQYFCSGEIPKDQWHHYGLAAPVYTHFTSPIRRYADIIVHRLLAAAIGVIPLPVSNADRTRQQEICSHMNRRHRAAQHVQRASVNMHTLLYFKNRPCNETAYVSSVKNEFFTVLIPRFGIEGTIDADQLATKLRAEYTFDPELHLLQFRANNNSNNGDVVVIVQIQVFQRVQVHIEAVEGSGGTRKLDITLNVDATVTGMSQSEGDVSAHVIARDNILNIVLFGENVLGGSSNNSMEICTEVEEELRDEEKTSIQTKKRSATELLLHRENTISEKKPAKSTASSTSLNTVDSVVAASSSSRPIKSANSNSNNSNSKAKGGGGGTQKNKVKSLKALRLKNMANK